MDKNLSLKNLSKDSLAFLITATNKMFAVTLLGESTDAPKLDIEIPELIKTFDKKEWKGKTELFNDLKRFVEFKNSEMSDIKNVSAALYSTENELNKEEQKLSRTTPENIKGLEESLAEVKKETEASKQEAKRKAEEFIEKTEKRVETRKAYVKVTEREVPPPTKDALNKYTKLKEDVAKDELGQKAKMAEDIKNIIPEDIKKDLGEEAVGALSVGLASYAINNIKSGTPDVDPKSEVYKAIARGSETNESDVQAAVGLSALASLSNKSQREVFNKVFGEGVADLVVGVDPASKFEAEVVTDESDASFEIDLDEMVGFYKSEEGAQQVANTLQSEGSFVSLRTQVLQIKSSVTAPNAEVSSAVKETLGGGIKKAGGGAGKAIAKQGFGMAVNKVANAAALAGGPITKALIFLGKAIGKIVPLKEAKKITVAVGGVSLFAVGVLVQNPVVMIGGASLTAYGLALRAGMTAASVGKGVVDFMGAVGMATIAAVGTPILTALLIIPVTVAFIIFIINSGAYVVPPSSRLSDIGADNPYLLVTKVPNLSKLGNGGTKKVTYTVTITALKSNLSNIKIVSSECTISKKAGGQSNCPPENIPEIENGLSVSPLSPHSFEFSAEYGSNITDSLIYDSITVSADTPEETGIVTTGSGSVCIGDCAVECINVSDSFQKWPGSLRANLESAIGTLGSKYPKFIGRVCRSNKPVNLCYAPPQIDAGYFAWHVHTDSCDVYYNEKGLKSANDALFLTTHELTHHVQKIDGGSVAQYLGSGGFFELTGRGFCTYKDTANSTTESMAEANGLYAAIPSWGGCVTNYKNQYPRNFNFAKNFME